MTRRGLRALVLGAALLALAVSGCGGGDDGGGPLDEVLGFLPRETPLVLAIDTDLRGGQARSAARLLDRYEFSDRLLQGLERSILGDVDFRTQVQPLLGNELVVGAVDPSSLLREEGDTDFVGAIEVRDRRSLRRALERGGARARGRRSGARLYVDSDGDTFAVREDVLVVSSDRGLLEDALARRAGGDGLEQQDLDDATAGLPEDALVRGYADVQGLLAADADTAAARAVEWVRALRRLGLTLSVAGDRVDVRFRMATEEDGLSDEELPLAAGGDSPPLVAGGGDVSVAIRDPAHIVAFAERAARAVDPDGFNGYAVGKRTLESAFGVDLERDLLGQLGDDVSIAIDFDGGFAVRAAVKDRARLESALHRLRPVIPSVAERIAGERVELAAPTRRRPFHALTTRDGEELAVYGLVEDVLVVATDAERARRLARERPRGVAGASGALVARGDAARIVRMLIATLGLDDAGRVSGRALARALGEATGSLEASGEGLEGRLSVALD